MKSLLPSLQTIPWWAQVGVTVVAIAGTVCVEYLKNERLKYASDIETDEGDWEE